MRQYILHSMVLLGFGLFFTGCEVGITPLEKQFNKAGVATSAEVNSNGDIGTITIDIQEGIDREELNVSIKLTGDGSQDFTVEIDKTAAGYIGEIKYNSDLPVYKEKTYNFFAQTIVNGQPMCMRKVQKTIPKNVESNRPTITLKGKNPVVITINSNYTDAGATAKDDTDGNITSQIQTSTISVSELGEHNITYSVSNSVGNTATVTRTVIVKTNPLTRGYLEKLLRDIDKNTNKIIYADTSGITNMDNLFKDNETFNLDISGWDTSNVTTLRYLFYGLTDFNQDISDWNTSSVTDMNSTFSGATAFNGDIGKWDTSSVKNMTNMFFGAKAFNSDIGSWKTDSVTDMNSMFLNAKNFNQEIGKWNTSNVTNMRMLFSGATAFNGNIGKWNTTNVTTMSKMFENATNFNKPIWGWETKKVMYMSYMFREATNFNQPIGDWNTSAVTSMGSMFAYASSFNQPIGKWHTENVTGMSTMFFKAKAFDQNISDWNVTKVISTGFQSFSEGSSLIPAHLPKFKKKK